MAVLSSVSPYVLLVVFVFLTFSCGKMMKNNGAGSCCVGKKNVNDYASANSASEVSELLTKMNAMEKQNQQLMQDIEVLKYKGNKPLT